MQGNLQVFYERFGIICSLEVHLLVFLRKYASRIIPGRKKRAAAKQPVLKFQTFTVSRQSDSFSMENPQIKSYFTTFIRTRPSAKNAMPSAHCSV